jgi:adenylate cyclase
MAQTLNRKQSIVYFSDIVGYTLLMGKDEDHAFDLMKQNLELHQEIFSKYRGKIIKELGDGILAIFETAEEAIKASYEVQKEWQKSKELQLRIGLHCGGIILDHGDVYGDAVNVASRVQSIGVPSCILFSSKVLEQLPKDLEFTYVNLGTFRLKNVAKELELYAVTNKPLATPKRAEMIKTVKFQEREPWKFWVAFAATISIFLFLIYSLIWNNYTWEKDKSVAVLPFTNVNAQSPQDAFSIDITQEIISQLSEIADIKVISFSSIKDISDSNLDLDSLGEALEVSTILKGSIQYLNEMTKVNVQLIDIEENKNLWTESFTRSGENLLQIQSIIAKEISRVLGISLTAKEEAEIGKVITESPEAYNLYLLAKKEYSNYNMEGFTRAAEYYKKAISIDRNFTMAYAGLADTYSQFAANTAETAWYDSSNIVTEKGLLIDPNSAELYKTRGNTFYYQGKLESAKKSFENATLIKPNYSEAIGNLATIDFSQGYLEDALNGQIRSASLNPNNQVPFRIAGWINRIIGNNTEALEWLKKSLNIAPNPVTYSLIGTAYISENRIEESKKLIPEILEKNPNTNGYESAGLINFFSKDFAQAKENYEKSILSFENFREDYYFTVPINYSYLLIQEGDNKTADSLLNNSIFIREEALSRGEKDANLLFDLACAYAAKKQTSQSLNYLNEAFENGWRDLFFIEYNPIFDYLRSNPEYRNITQKISAEVEREKNKINATSLERSR